jgi:hypothetical protein
MWLESSEREGVWYKSQLVWYGEKGPDFEGCNLQFEFSSKDCAKALENFVLFCFGWPAKIYLAKQDKVGRRQNRGRSTYSPDT